jgi:TetR/AcrR family transcriptional repressor of lmrAB and yxaGH operons
MSRRRGRPPKARAGVSTRARIVTGAAQLLRRRGYAATGLNDIVVQSRAPKGSLYHYFPGGKEELASEAIAQSARVVTETIDGAFARSADVPDLLQRFAHLLARNLERSGFRDGCPVGTVTLDAAAESERIGHACAESFAGWRDAIAANLGRRGLSPRESTELAVLMLCAFEGALMMSRALRDTAPLFEIATTLSQRVPTTKGAT